jgi:PPOX class probable F420-dependent enzyme
LPGSTRRPDGRLRLTASPNPRISTKYRDSTGAWLLVEVWRDTAKVDREVALRRVLSARVARLVTVDADGCPHLVPIVFDMHDETLYTAVDAKPKRSRRLRRVENARARPDVSVLVDRYEDDWSRLWWVRLAGWARVLDAGAEAELALRLLIEKYEQYRRERPYLPGLALDVRDWRGWEPLRVQDDPAGNC